MRNTLHIADCTQSDVGALFISSPLVFVPQHHDMCEYVCVFAKCIRVFTFSLTKLFASIYEIFYGNTSLKSIANNEIVNAHPVVEFQFGVA